MSPDAAKDFRARPGLDRDGQEYQNSADVRLHQLYVLFAKASPKAGRVTRRRRRPSCPRCLDAPSQRDEGRTQYRHGEIDPMGEEQESQCRGGAPTRLPTMWVLKEREATESQG